MFVFVFGFGLCPAQLDIVLSLLTVGQWSVLWSLVYDFTDSLIYEAFACAINYAEPSFAFAHLIFINLDFRNAKTTKNNINVCVCERVSVVL